VPTNLMDNVVTKSQISERSRLAWRAKSFFVVLKNFPFLSRE
jgi:hypothetical protein